MKHFNIVTNGRTGSSFLVRLLNSHPQILCLGELFHPSVKRYGTERFENPEAWITEQYRINRCGKEICGCKFIYPRDKKMIENFCPEGINIFLFRKDLARQAISSALAIHSNNWEDYTKKLNQRFVLPVDLIERQYQYHLKLEEQLNEFIEQCDITKSYIVYYEEFSPDIFNGLFNFLGAEKIPEIQFEKNVQSEKIFYLIENIEDIEKKFIVKLT